MDTNQINNAEQGYVDALKECSRAANEFFEAEKEFAQGELYFVDKQKNDPTKSLTANVIVSFALAGICAGIFYLLDKNVFDGGIHIAIVQIFTGVVNGIGRMHYIAAKLLISFLLGGWIGSCFIAPQVMKTRFYNDSNGFLVMLGLIGICTAVLFVTASIPGISPAVNDFIIKGQQNMTGPVEIDDPYLSAKAGGVLGFFIGLSIMIARISSDRRKITKAYNEKILPVVKIEWPKARRNLKKFQSSHGNDKEYIYFTQDVNIYIMEYKSRINKWHTEAMANSKQSIDIMLPKVIKCVAIGVAFVVAGILIIGIGGGLNTASRDFGRLPGMKDKTYIRDQYGNERPL